MENSEFQKALSERIDAVFRSHRDRDDHRKTYPWLTGSLGDPAADVVFVAENPSVSQLDKAKDPSGGPPTREAQWNTSEGDKLFREALVVSGFKHGGFDSLGGWNCYITNVIKEAAYVNKWKRLPEPRRDHVADIWADVLRWELDAVKPYLLVAMGNEAERHLKRLHQARRINLPELMKIKHYSHIHYRPNDPHLRNEYISSIMRVRLRLDEVSAPTA